MWSLSPYAHTVLIIAMNIYFQDLLVSLKHPLATLGLITPEHKLLTIFVVEFCYCIYQHQNLLTQISTQLEKLLIVVSSQL